MAALWEGMAERTDSLRRAYSARVMKGVTSACCEWRPRKAWRRRVGAARACRTAGENRDNIGCLDLVTKWGGVASHLGGGETVLGERVGVGGLADVAMLAAGIEQGDKAVNCGYFSSVNTANWL